MSVNNISFLCCGGYYIPLHFIRIVYWTTKILLLLLITIALVGCDSQGPEDLKQREQFLSILENNPNESFHELVKLRKFHSFLLSEHPDIDKFSPMEKVNEVKKFEGTFSLKEISSDGYLASGVTAAEKLGIFQIFSNANKKSQKTIPDLRIKNTFVPKYVWLILGIQQMSLFYQYKIITLLEIGDEGQAITYLDDYINAELLSAPTMRTVRFIDFLMRKYKFSSENYNKLLVFKEKIHLEIMKIKNSTKRYNAR